jgi:hypothetical protein
MGRRECHFEPYLALNLHGQEIADNAHKMFPLLPMGDVARFREGVPFDLWNTFEEGRDAGVLGLIVATVEDERRYFDVVQLGDDRPRFQTADNVKLGRSVPASRKRVGLAVSFYVPPARRREKHVHSVINGWIFRDGAKRFGDELRHRLDSTDVLPVEHVQRILVFLRVRRPSILMLL